METTKAAVATITRTKLVPTPGTNYRAAWNWMYHVSIDGGDSVAIGTRLGSAVDWAKRRAAKVVKAWETGAEKA